MRERNSSKGLLRNGQLKNGQRSKTMKLAVLVYEYPPTIVGGLGTYSAEITRQFVLMDNDVTVFTMNDDANSLPTRDIWRGIEIHRPQHIDISESFPVVVAGDIKKWGSTGIQWFSKILMYNYLGAAKLARAYVHLPSIFSFHIYSSSI